jgi:hypothetical protein
MPHRTLSPRALLGLALLGFGGCATAPTKDAKADSGEYEWVTPLGSNVPVRVRKGESAPSSSPIGTMNADQATQAIRGAGAPQPKGSD